MATAEEERKERIKRNHAMLRNVTNAAEDLASSVPTSSQPDPEAVRKEELKQRLAFEAQQHGLRKSSRLASSAARTRITKSLHSDDPPCTESTSASGSMDGGTSSDDQESGLRESPRAHGRVAAEEREMSLTQPVASQDGATSQEEQDMQLAIAISLADDGLDQNGTTQVEKSGTGGAQEGIGVAGDTTQAAPDRQTPRCSKDDTAKPRHHHAAGASQKKQGRKRKKRLDLEDDDIDAVFDFIGQGKVTVGRSEIVSVINKLGLDVDETMVDAAFEVLELSDCAGPCNRLDRAGLRRFMVHLEE